MIVDGHAHVWDLAVARYPWLGPSLGPIHRTIGADELTARLDGAGIDAVVLVQAADEPGDTAVLRAVAEAEPRVRGLVVWAPLDRPEALADVLDDAPLVVGVRTLQHDRPDPDWITRPGPDRGLGVLAARGLPYDYVTADPAAMRHLPGIAERHPALALVLDHLGKPPVGGALDEYAHWRRLLAEAARNPRLVAKVSGLYPAPGVPWRLGDQARVLDDALDLLGPARLMIGPFLELKQELDLGQGVSTAVCAPDESPHSAIGASGMWRSPRCASR